jgi:hypothetical protein
VAGFYKFESDRRGYFLLFEVGTLALALLVGIFLYVAEERKSESPRPVPSTSPARDFAATARLTKQQIKLSDPQLKKRGRTLITELRKLQTRYDEAGKDANSFETSWAALDREFRQRFYNEALVMEGELVARLRRHGQKQHQDDLVTITACSVLRMGSSVGADPYSAVATYIERMLNQMR